MKKMLRFLFVAGVAFCVQGSFAEQSSGGAENDEPQENASNPLAKASNTDVRWQYLDNVAGEGRVNDVFIDGATMLSPKFKLKYELHYWETDITGSSEHDWESVLLKGIYFPKQGVLDNGVKYRLALGLDVIFDFDNQDKGIGENADQIGPFVGLALGFNSGTMLIPLVQHYENFSGDDVSTTAFRLIGLQVLPKDSWLKMDVKVPVDWENDNDIPASGELQFGKNLSRRLALYTDVLGGIGGDRIFDWGVGAGVRIKY